MVEAYKVFTDSEVKVSLVAATKNAYSNKVIATLLCEYPRYIHSEIMTHRQLSRNSGSSRATPFNIYCERITKDPAFFAELGINKSGMNADVVLGEEAAAAFKQEYIELMQHTVDTAKHWSEKYNLHKQIINRVLEPYVRTSTVITATEWDNFLYTRATAKGVEPVMHLLAKCIGQAVEYANETAKSGVAHLPFITEEERNTESLKDCITHAVSRSARCTILSNVTKKLSTIEEDNKLYSWLANADPMHASPFEHIAFATNSYEPYYNLRGGWMSQRYILDTQRLIEGVCNTATKQFAQ